MIIDKCHIRDDNDKDGVDNGDADDDYGIDDNSASHKDSKFDNEIIMIMIILGLMIAVMIVGENTIISLW